MRRSLAGAARLEAELAPDDDDAFLGVDRNRTNPMTTLLLSTLEAGGVSVDGSTSPSEPGEDSGSESPATSASSPDALVLTEPLAEECCQMLFDCLVDTVTIQGFVYTQSAICNSLLFAQGGSVICGERGESQVVRSGASARGSVPHSGLLLGGAGVVTAAAAGAGAGAGALGDWGGSGGA